MTSQSDQGPSWERVLGGDADAFSQIFDEYSDLIYNVAFRRTGSWDAAEEIVSTAFLEDWQENLARRVAGEAQALDVDKLHDPEIAGAQQRLRDAHTQILTGCDTTRASTGYGTKGRPSQGTSLPPTSVDSSAMPPIYSL